LQQFRPNLFGALAVALLLAFSAPVAKGQVSVTTVDGTQVDGELLAWDAEGVTISSEEGAPTTWSVDQLLAIRWPQHEADTNADPASIELMDGTLLPIITYEVSDSQAEVGTPLSEGKLQVSTTDIRRVQFTPLVEQLTTLWEELHEKQLAADLLIIHKKKGTVLDYLTGLLGNITSEQVTFNWEGDEIPVKWSKVAALAYYHANGPDLAPAVCWLQTKNGGRLPIATAVFEEGMLRVTTVGGLDFRLPQDSLIAADFSQGKLSYLSDLEPIKQTWTPRIALPAAVELIQGYGQPRRDQSFTGSALTLTWPKVTDAATSKSVNSNEIRTYRKGLAIRSRTEIVYRLPKNMQRFVAIAGIDPNTASQGNVTLEIFADDRVVWQGEIAGKRQPTEIDVQLEGARQLRIFVDYGANLDFGDRLHLVDARVTK